MEHNSFPVITGGSKELAIGRARSDCMLIHSDQGSDSIDRRGHGDCEISLQKSG